MRPHHVLLLRDGERRAETFFQGGFGGGGGERVRSRIRGGEKKDAGALLAGGKVPDLMSQGQTAIFKKNGTRGERVNL